MDTNMNWIKPTNVEQAKWDWWLAGPVPAQVAKLLADHHVTVVSVHPDNSFYGYLKVRKDDRNFTVGLNEITTEHSLKEVAGFLKHWDKTVKAYNDSANILDPFFSNLIGISSKPHSRTAKAEAKPSKSLPSG